MSENSPVTQFLRWWAVKCGRNWAIVISIATGLVALYATIPVVAELRFWTTRAETSLIADKVYPREIEEQKLRIIIAKERIRWLEALGIKMSAVQRGELDDFRRQLIRAENTLTDLSREQARFKLEQEHR